ncbi:hypothetical protein C0J52_09673 [Blattella germanica]|nr:hypothetical protein C0J52_09673 [Blattella germanica]
MQEMEPNRPAYNLYQRQQMSQLYWDWTWETQVILLQVWGIKDVLAVMLTRRWIIFYGSAQYWTSSAIFSGR